MNTAADRALFLFLIFMSVGALLSAAGLVEIGCHWLDRHVRFRLRRWQCALTILKCRYRLRFQHWLKTQRTE